MTGCRHNAKNTLAKNYLYLAERAGAEVHPAHDGHRGRGREPAAATTSTTVAPVPGCDGRERRALTAEQVVFAAGALGTQRLLHRMRDDGALPISRPARAADPDQLRVDPRRDRTRPRPRTSPAGVAITSSFHPDAHDTRRAGPLRQGQQRDGPAADGADRRRRPAAALAGRWVRRDVAPAGASCPACTTSRHWSERTVIALVMQSLDNSITTYTRRSRLTGRRG